MNARPPRLALLGESLVDESALAILVEAVLGRPFVQVQPGLRARGWPSVLQILPAVARSYPDEETRRLVADQTRLLVAETLSKRSMADL
jgi:hypothetical protein